MEQNFWLPVMLAAAACVLSAVSALCRKTTMETKMLLWIVSIAEEQMQNITLQVQRSHNKSTFYFLDKMQGAKNMLYSNIQHLTVMVTIFLWKFFFLLLRFLFPFLVGNIPNMWHYRFLSLFFWHYVPDLCFPTVLSLKAHTHYVDDLWTFHLPPGSVQRSSKLIVSSQLCCGRPCMLNSAQLTPNNSIGLTELKDSLKS